MLKDFKYKVQHDLEAVVVETGDVTTSVNEEGTPVPTENPPTADVFPNGSEEHDFNTEYLSAYAMMTPIATAQITCPFDEINKRTPRCPVYITQDPTTNKLFITAYITGVISDIYDYVDLIDTLNVMQEGDQIFIFIDSPGGYVATGAHIASCIHKCLGEATTIARGFCASAASLIWSSGKHCRLTPFSVFMYHMSSHGDMGNSVAIMSRAFDMVRYVSSTLLSVPLAKGHITEEELKNICMKTNDTYIDAKTMYTRIKQAA